MDVMAGFWVHWVRTSWPMKPVEPVRMTFMVDCILWKDVGVL